VKQLSLIHFLLTAFAAAAYTQSTYQLSIDTLTVQIDNHNIQLYRMGHGTATVVMEAGLGANHKCWQEIDAIVAKSATVITYDRPGYLASDSCSKVRDAVTVANELHEALQQANIRAPYLLVGWSLGGVFVRVFADLFPEDVSAMVLVDPVPEESYKRFQKEYPELLYEDSLYIKEVLASKRTGERQEVIAYDSSMNQARRAIHCYKWPTLLLIATRGKAPGRYANDPNNPINLIWKQELIKWAKKSRNVKHKIVESGHHIAKEKPEIVVNAIVEVIEKVTNSNQ
jgi:pimeloyl-ACP methyl ester carboxylesterase